MRQRWSQNKCLLMAKDVLQFVKLHQPSLLIKKNELNGAESQIFVTDQDAGQPMSSLLLDISDGHFRFKVTS